MARKPKPWFRKGDDWWYVEINGKQIRLAKEKKNAKEAGVQFHRLMTELAANPVAGSAEPTVASLLDKYLVHLRSQKRSGRTIYERRRYLQLFAEAHGQLVVSMVKAFHL
jgi:DNA-binding FadR family transcriptional regulator